MTAFPNFGIYRQVNRSVGVLKVELRLRRPSQQKISADDSIGGTYNCTGAALGDKVKVFAQFGSVIFKKYLQGINNNG